MTARLHDDARRVVFEEADDLETARASIAKLRLALRRILYVEIENELARELGASPLCEPSPPSAITPQPTSHNSAPIPTALDNQPLPTELTFKKAKQIATQAFERDYLSRVMMANNNSVTHAALAAGVERVNFRKLLQRNGLRPHGTKVPSKSEHAATYTDRILRILNENTHGLRTCEIAEKIEQAINFAFGILKWLARQGRVARHGNRYNALWTLPGVEPVPRIETIPAAAIAVLSQARGPMDAKQLREEMLALLSGGRKPPSRAALLRGIGRLLSNGTLACHGANEHGAMYILTPKGDAAELN